MMGIGAEPVHYEHRSPQTEFPTDAAVDGPDTDRAAGSAARSVNVKPGLPAITAHRVDGDDRPRSVSIPALHEGLVASRLSRRRLSIT
jgi:hypothetical protein